MLLPEKLLATKQVYTSQLMNAWYDAGSYCLEYLMFFDVH